MTCARQLNVKVKLTKKGDSSAAFEIYSKRLFKFKRGNPHDNAVAESFFNLLTQERRRRRAHKTGVDARQDVLDDIEILPIRNTGTWGIGCCRRMTVILDISMMVLLPGHMLLGGLPPLKTIITKTNVDLLSTNGRT